MKKTLSRALALLALVALAATLPGCYPYEGPDDPYGYAPVGVSVSVYGGYSSPGWGGCCYGGYGGPIGMPRPVPY